MCHAAEPVWAPLETLYQRPLLRAPKQVHLETPEQIRRHMRDIKLQAAYASAMPPGNITDMTDAERATAGGVVGRTR